jgi:hypothetical protein
VLRRIFEPNRDEVTVDWRKFHNEELHNLYSSPSIIRIIKSRRMRWAGHVALMGENRNAYRILVGKPEAKKALGGCTILNSMEPEVSLPCSQEPSTGHYPEPDQSNSYHFIKCWKVLEWMKE